MSDAGQSQDEDDAGPGLEWPQVRDFLLRYPCHRDGLDVAHVRNNLDFP